MNEQWRPIPGFPGYEVSDKGRVLSRQMYHGSDRPRLMSTPTHDDGYRIVHLTADGASRVVRVHLLVTAAFLGPRPDGMVVRHLDGDAGNNALLNLRYGTASENSFDQVRHGTHPFAGRTRCKQGHEYTAENTAIQMSSAGRPYRQCKTCNRDRVRRQRRRRLERAA